MFWCAKATLSADLLLRIFTEFNEQRKIYGLVLGGEKLYHGIICSSQTSELCRILQLSRVEQGNVKDVLKYYGKGQD